MYFIAFQIPWNHSYSISGLLHYGSQPINYMSTKVNILQFYYKFLANRRNLSDENGQLIDFSMFRKARCYMMCTGMLCFAGISKIN